jgi:hypothetical protein
MLEPVRSRAPPLWFVQCVANPLMRRVLPTRFGRCLPGFALLRFHGRRTGRSYEVPAGIYDHEGAQFVFSESGWTANFGGGLPVEVVRRGATTLAHGELVTDPAVAGPAMRAALAAGTSQRMLGIAIDRGHTPTDAELAAIRRAVVIRPVDPLS